MWHACFGERSGFVVLSGLGRAGDWAPFEGVECVNVGLERVRGLAMVWMERGLRGLGWGGAVAVGVWSV